MVEDPIAKVKFPKFAAGATLEVRGKTHYFIDDLTRQQFQAKQTATKSVKSAVASKAGQK